MSLIQDVTPVGMGVIHPDGSMGGLSGGSGIAQKLLANNMHPGCLRPYYDYDGVSQRITIMNNGAQEVRPVNNALLGRREWELWDDAIVKLREKRLGVVDDIRARGLVKSVNGMASSVYKFQKRSGIQGAKMAMAMDHHTDGDRMDFSEGAMPLPFIHLGFNLDARFLATARSSGLGIDSDMIEECGKEMMRYAETVFIQGADSFTFGGGTIYGMLDFPDRTTGSLGTAWDALSPTSVKSVGEQIVAQVLAMKTDALAGRSHAPWQLIIPAAYEVLLDDDYIPGEGTRDSIRDRIMRISGVDSIMVSDYMTDDNIIFLELDSSTVRVVDGLAMTIVQWEDGGGMNAHYKLLMIRLPQFRSDKNSRSGVIHYS